MKHLTLLITLFFTLNLNAQVNSVPNSLETQKYNESVKGTGDMEMFNNIDHPLAISGGLLCIGGAVTYLTGGNSSTPGPLETNQQFIGAGIFAAGAVMFTIFSTERAEKVPKHKKEKTYNSNDWEVPK